MSEIMVSFLGKYLRKRRRHFWDDVLNRLHPRSWALGDSGHLAGLTHSAYINLDSRPDRRDHVEAQFAKLAIVPQRIAGEYLESFSDFEGRFPEFHSRPRSRFLEVNPNGGLGYIGCYIGHLRALESCPSDDGFSLICEDDWNVLRTNLIRWIRDYLNVSFDILLIDPQGDYKKSDQLRRNLYRVSEVYPCYWGAHAYLVRNSSRDKILELLATAPLDSPDHSLMGLHRELGVYAVRTSLSHAKGAMGTNMKRGASGGVKGGGAFEDVGEAG